MAHDDMALMRVRDAGLKDGSWGWLVGEHLASLSSSWRQEVEGAQHTKEWGQLGDDLLHAMAEPKTNEAACQASARTREIRGMPASNKARDDDIEEGIHGDDHSPLRLESWPTTLSSCRRAQYPLHYRLLGLDSKGTRLVAGLEVKLR